MRAAYGSPFGTSADVRDGLAIVPKRSRGCGTDSRHSLRRYPNLIKGMQPERSNQVWVADIIYLRVGSEFIYLAVIMDVFTRSVRGWHLSWTAGQNLTLARTCALVPQAARGPTNRLTSMPASAPSRHISRISASVSIQMPLPCETRWMITPSLPATGQKYTEPVANSKPPPRALVSLVYSASLSRETRLISSHLRVVICRGEP